MVGVRVGVRIGLNCSSGVRLGSEVGVTAPAAVWAAKTVCAAAVLAAPALFAGVVPPPQPLSKSAGTRPESTMDKNFFMRHPPIPMAAVAIAAFDGKNKVYRIIEKNVISER